MRSFFKSVLASFVALVLFVTLGVGGAVLLLASIASNTSSKPAIKDDTILAFDLSLNIADASSTPGVESILTGSTPNAIALRSVTRAIEQAAKDDRISGLYLSGDLATSGLGWASLRELRQALQAFRDAGKPIFAYETAGNERDYYLTSIANTLLVDPSAAIEFNGLKSETTYYANALQKYGVGVQVLRVGRYKSFVEPFIRPNSSPENRQQTQQLLNDLWGEFLATVGKSRTLTPRQLTTIANTQGLLLADQAVRAGLADKVAHADEVAAQLRAVTGEQEADGDQAFRQISIPGYVDAIEDSAGGDRIAVVYAEGNIVDGEGGSGQIGGDQLADQLRELREDDDIKAIVLRVNSPGGSAAASDIISREVKLIAAQKPIIVSMGDVAASGGYLISTYASEIFASPNTITGSIGVFGLLPNVQRLANSNGINWDVVATGPLANSETIARPKTPQELQIGQRVVNQIYDRFVGDVATGRKLDRNRVGEIAQGRVWSGVQAEKIGLIDRLGGLEDAIRAAAAQAKLGDDWQVDEYPKSRSFREQILKDLLGSETQAADPLSIELQRLQGELETLRSMNDPKGAYMRLPINFNIE